MKKWFQLVQKYIFPTTLIVFGVLFIYGLIFATPVSSLIRIMVKPNGLPNTAKIYNDLREMFPTVDYVVDNTQVISNLCLIFAIIGLVLCGIGILLRTNIRKRYYLTNFVCLSVIFVYSIFVVCYLSVQLVLYVKNLVAIDFEYIHTQEPFVRWFVDSNYKYIDGFGFYHILGFIILAILLFVSFNFILLFINKIKYGKEFKMMIEGGNNNAL